MREIDQNCENGLVYYSGFGFIWKKEVLARHEEMKGNQKVRSQLAI